jgi:ribose 5-phosphate isomerase
MQLRDIPGVADHGLFLGLMHTLLIAHGDNVEEIQFPQENRW